MRTVPPAGTRTVSDSRPVPARTADPVGAGVASGIPAVPGSRRRPVGTPARSAPRSRRPRCWRPGAAAGGCGRGNGPGVEVAAPVAGGRADPVAVDEQVQRPVAGGDRPAGVRRPGSGRGVPPARRVRDLRGVGAVPVEPGGADLVGGALARQEPARRPVSARRHAHRDVALVGQVEHPGRRGRGRWRSSSRWGFGVGSGGPGVAGVRAGPPGAAGLGLRKRGTWLRCRRVSEQPRTPGSRGRAGPRTRSTRSRSCRPRSGT